MRTLFRFFMVSTFPRWVNLSIAVLVLIDLQTAIGQSKKESKDESIPAIQLSESSEFSRGRERSIGGQGGAGYRPPLLIGYDFIVEKPCVIDALGFYLDSGEQEPQSIALYDRFQRMVAGGKVKFNRNKQQVKLYKENGLFKIPIRPLSLQPGEAFTIAAFYNKPKQLVRLTIPSRYYSDGAIRVIKNRRTRSIDRLVFPDEVETRPSQRLRISLGPVPFLKEATTTRYFYSRHPRLKTNENGEEINELDLIHSTYEWTTQKEKE